MKKQIVFEQMFNKNYLGHNLIPLKKYYETGDYICTICKIELYYEHYYDKYNSILGGGFCELNCKEYFIKSILE